MNMCIDCANCYAHKCEYLSKGKPTTNQVWEKSEHGIKIISCKDYTIDNRVRKRIWSEQLAEWFGVNKRTIYRWVKNGKLDNELKEKGLLLKRIEREYYKIEKLKENRER